MKPKYKQRRQTKKMKRQGVQRLRVAAGLFVAFTLWTAAVRLIDVQPIGPNGSAVGFSAWNAAVHDWTGVHWPLYTITDWLGLVPVGFAMGFGILGLAHLAFLTHLRKTLVSL